MEKRAVGAGSQTAGAVPPRIARLRARFKRARERRYPPAARALARRRLAPGSEMPPRRVPSRPAAAVS